MEISKVDQILDDYKVSESISLTQKFAHEIYTEQEKICPVLFDFLLMSKWIAWVRNN